MNEADRQPAAVSAQPRRAGGGSGRHEQLLRRVRQRRRRAGRQHHQVGHERVSTATGSNTGATAAWPRTPGTTTAAAPRRPTCRSTSSAPPSAGRSSRTSCSSSATIRDSCATVPASRSSASRRQPGASGDFSGVDVTIRDPQTGQPFPGNQHSTRAGSARSRGRCSPTSSCIRCRTGRATSNNLVTGSSDKQRAHQGDVKIDANLSTNDRMFGRFSLSELQVRAGAARRSRANLIGTNDSPFLGLAFNWNRTIVGDVAERVARSATRKVKFQTIPEDWAGIGDANASSAFPAGSRFPGLSSFNISGDVGFGDAGIARVQRHQELSDHREILDVQGPPLS